MQAQRLIEQYLALAGHGADAAGPVFRPVTDNRTKELDRPLNPNSIYRNIVQKYGLEAGISAQVNGLCVHSVRATRPPPMRSRMRPTSPKSRNGSATPMSPPRGYTTDARASRRTARRFA